MGNKGIPLKGDRAARDARNYPDVHTTDNLESYPFIHTPEPNAVGKTIQSFTSGSAYGWELTDFPDTPAIVTGGHNILDEGNTLPYRPALNFQGGLVWAVDNAGQSRTDIIISGSSSGTGGHVIQDEGTPLTARANLNFVGANVIASDDPANDATKIFITGSGGAGGGSEIGAGAYASLPAGTEKDLYFPTDGFNVYRKGASAWSPWGPLFPMTKPPAVSDFTWLNSGTATAVETYGGIVLTTSASASGMQGLYKAAPVSTPWKLTIAFFPIGAIYTNYISFGAFFRQSSDGKMAFLRLVNYNGDYIFNTKYSDATTEAGHYDYDPLATIIGRHVRFFRIEDNGTNRICSLSNDGLNFWVYHSVGRTDYLTADQIGFAAIGVASVASVMNLLSWKVE